MTTTNYPLTWPDGWPRTESGWRENGKFSTKSTRYTDHGSYQQTTGLTTSGAVTRVIEEIRRMGIDVEDIIISTNIKTRLDGFPRSGQRAPDDPGAAVYWQEDDRHRVIAIDRYHKVEHNLAAIAATIAAMRGIERWGGAKILERVFKGFDALPSPEDVEPGNPWWEELRTNQDAPHQEIQLAYRRRRKETHPDMDGGSTTAFMAVQAAYDVAKAERGFA